MQIKKKKEYLQAGKKAFLEERKENQKQDEEGAVPLRID